MHSASAILAMNDPERLFSGPDHVKDEYRVLAKTWHPDLNKDKDASRVAAHINMIYQKALKKITDGTWSTPGLLKLTGIDGKRYEIRFHVKHDFELGEIFYGKTTITYVVKNEFADLFENARKTISRLHYKDSAMEKEFSKLFPKIKTTFETIDNKCVMVLEKTPDVYMLKDVMKASGGKIDPKHVAWIQNRIYSIACYLEYAGLSHNDISPESIFISPEYHTACLYGGWFFATPVGAKLNAVSARTYRHAPPDVIRDKKGSIRTDLTMVRVTGRELLGDITGLNLDSTIQKDIKNFLRYPTGGDARRDFNNWGEVLQTTFGKRRFIKMDIKDSDIFQY